MKKILIILALSGTITSIYAETYTNKTFMNQPSSHYFLPLQNTTWHRLLKQGSTAKNPWGISVQAVPFYHKSNNEFDLGKYFGTNEKCDIKIDAAAQGVDVQNSLLVHHVSDPGALAFKGILSIKPEHTMYGAHLCYHQELENIHHGIYLRIDLPIEHITNDPHAGASNDTPFVDPDTGKKFGILDFFAGAKKTTNVPADAQAALASSKINGLQSKTGVGDLAVYLGYKFADKPDYTSSGNIKVMIPTGSAPSGEFLFEPIAGTKHWGLGVGFDTTIAINKTKSDSFEFLMHLDYTYLFKADETRTLGYKNAVSYTGTTEDIAVFVPWSHYFLGGENGKAGLMPLTNILTRPVGVQPGGILQGSAAFAYHRNNTTIDFGYSFFSQEGDKVTVKNWKNETYAAALLDYDATTVFDYNHTVGGWISDYELDAQQAANPSVLKHTVYLGLGYTVSEWENPMMMGVGASVDWSQDNATPIGYTLWIKAGASF